MVKRYMLRRSLRLMKTAELEERARCVRRMLWVVAVYLLALACLLLLVGGVYELVRRFLM
ncbi:MAG: hypothetical protein IJN23_03670 [Akkermansia sp.]|nr:hypothetical protein [Akkermansia sp.]